jgi:hypothetical protein
MQHPDRFLGVKILLRKLYSRITENLLSGRNGNILLKLSEPKTIYFKEKIETGNSLGTTISV